jgi:hypothetical protein
MTFKIIHHLPHPCPPPAPSWYYGPDDERLEAGDFATKEDAIAEALGQGCYREDEPDGETGWTATMYVGVYQPKHVNLARWFRDADLEYWLECRAEDIDCEGLGADEDGNHSPFDDVTEQDKAALLESIQLAIYHWQARRQLKMRSYYLDSAGPSDYVTVPHPNEAAS